MSNNWRSIVSVLVLFCAVGALNGQTRGGKSNYLTGKVLTLEENGDTTAVYMASLQWLHTAVGTYTDVDGAFVLPYTDADTLIVRYSFYKADTLVVKPQSQPMTIFIKTAQALQEVVVKQHHKQKYVRKDNPAIALIRKVIEHKDFNRIESLDSYRADSYEKMIMALDKFDLDFKKNKFNQKFSFLKDYIDTSQFDTVPVLTISLRETMAEQYYQRSPRKTVRYVTAKRLQGVDDILDKEGLGSNLDAMFTEVNIFDNDIELMLNRFVSPLSSTLAIAYYHYYITDTVDVDGVSCVELSFTPVNSQSFGFNGRLYVVNDGTYALRKYSINVPFKINMNFVSQLRLEAEFFKTEEGLWAPKTTQTFAKFYLFKKMRQIYARQTKLYYRYMPGTTLPDSLKEVAQSGEGIAANARKFSKRQWEDLRPVPLTPKESFIDSLVPELRRIPSFNAVVKTVEIIGSGYIATARDRNHSYFDIGPIYNMISYNRLEGVRLRIGGMTTANLHDRWFMNGYIAFGCKDLRLKYNATLIHSFVKKEYHPYESLRHALYLSTSYDVEVPGQSYAYMDRDNVLMSFNVGSPLRAMQYVRLTRLRYEKEWTNRFSIDTWLQHENNEAAGTLAYWRINREGTASKVKYFNAFEWSFQLRWAPGEPLYNNRLGKESPFNLSKDAPVIRITHTIGVMDFRFWYNRTEISAEKRFWLSSFGHIDAMLQTGIVWNKVPFPKLYIPQSNQSLFLTPNTFNLMKPMEFIMDQYVALYATYYLKGWIFNRIPLWNRLKLREVVSFSGIYGGLSPKNTPTNNSAGLYLLPDGCSPMGKVPYMEITAGIENILKFIRIDYVRRLTYTKGLSGWQKNGIRFTFRISL